MSNHHSSYHIGWRTSIFLTESSWRPSPGWWRSDDHVPSNLQAEYYAQRASAGLIIAEATAISLDEFGWTYTPGLWTEEHVRGWRRVTDAVHAAGGRIIAQLWHTCAISHPELLDGAQPVSASYVDPGQISVTRMGRKPTVTPRPLTKIDTLVQ